MVSVIVQCATCGRIVETVGWPETPQRFGSTSAEGALEFTSKLLADLTKRERATELSQEP